MISESTKTQATNNSVLIEFDTGNRGIILPMVDETPNLTGGTFAVNKISKSVQYSNGESWIDLTTQGELIEHNFANVGDENANGVIIGSETTSKSQNETLDVLSSEITNFNDINDIYNYIDKIFEILKNNEYFYKLLLNSNEAYKFANNIIDKLTDRLLIYFHNKELEVNFYTYGCAILIIKHFRNNKYSLNDINLFMKETLKQLF